MKLPQAFIERTRAILGDEWDAFEQALQEESPTSIRVNPAKIEDVQRFMTNVSDSVSPVSWASNACYLDKRPVFTLDPTFHAGCYYVQEASSMYLEQIIRKEVKEPAKVLDLCAAPGGKSTQLSSVLPQGSFLTANEVIRSRAHILTENLAKWGSPFTVVSNNDPADIGKLKSFFDVIVADVPCSGEGMFRKDAAAINEWSVNNVQLCAERQRRIIADVWSALKPGGLLIYSTCTYNREENENNIAWICDELGADLSGEPHRFWPHKTKGEGFFIAAVRKKQDPDLSNQKTKQVALPKAIKNNPVADWLVHPDSFVIWEDKNKLRALPEAYYQDYLILKEKLHIVSAGHTLAEIKGRDLIPEHALAMSTSLNKEAFPLWEVDKETALQYLRREALQHIPDHLPKGFILITYHNHPLGFVKNIGNRANNLYPQEWRIRNL